MRQLGEPARDDKFDTREIVEQLRDWTLFAAVERHADTPKDLAEILFDFPAVRYGHMAHVSKFRYGQMRTAIISDTNGLALIPAGLSGAARRDILAEAADALRTDLGHQPELVEVYEYEFADSHQTGTMLHAEPVDGDTLFSDSYGYIETEIRGRADFKNFVEKADDIVFVFL